jgi:putative SOS response-associated peptidase YedK
MRLVILAGLWKMQEQRDGTFTQAFVILTTRANTLMAPIHNRMPVVLEESQFDAWMDPNASDAPLPAMLRPAPDDWLTADPASPLVNNVKNQGPELLGALLD